MKQPHPFRLLLAIVVAFVSAAGNPASAQVDKPTARTAAKAPSKPPAKAGPSEPIASIGAVPTLQRAALRKSHAGVNYDLGLPLAGASGIEPRNLAAGLTVVFTFDQNVSSGSFVVSGGQATAGTATFSGNQVLVPLTNVGNAQTVTVTGFNVVGVGGSLPMATVPFRVLEGDVNGSGSVSVADVNLAKYYVGAAVTPFNFRSDVNLSNGVSVSDINLAKFRVGTSVAGGPQANTAPSVAAIPAQNTTTGTAAVVNFTVYDAESPADSLGLRALSDNQGLLPDANIVLAGTGNARTATLTPTAGQTGSATITFVTSDGLLTSNTSFTLTVSPQSGGGGGSAKLFVTTLRPEGTAQSPGSGASTLQLSADETYAIVRVNYSNLTTAKTGMHVHGPADPGATGGILFDLDTTPPQPDGSWRWTFVQSGNITVAQQIAALKNGRLYVNVHSSKYPSGELRGHYLGATGSQNFTPPPSPPAPAPVIPANDNDAVRFLAQATYGPNDDLIAQVKSQGYSAWIDNQFNAGQTKQLDILNARRGAEGSLNFNHYWDSWWKLANTAPDQLRQRVAFALAQHFVVSYKASILEQFPAEMGNYYDLLARGATGNFRQLMEDVTLSPIMGEYLNLRASSKVDPAKGIGPNENYARELMQLFCIGLNELHPDGTLKLDADGQPIETYDQNVILGISRALTGWNYYQTGNPTDIPPWNMMQQMTPVPQVHDTGSKTILGGVVIPAGGTVQSDTKIVLDTIFNHPNVGPFVAKALIQKLVCSNPSPGYVYRVAQKFNNNGSGVRGDMKAVIKAILTDYEARHNDMITQQGFGKLREPLLRSTYLQRALHGTSNTGNWAISLTDEELGQTPMAAPTVFNFFEPGYVHPGVLAQNGLVAPEFQITNETTTMTVSNWIYWGVFSGWKWGDIKCNLQTEANLAGNANALVERLNTLLCAGQLSSSAKTAIVNHVNTIPAGEALTRARTAAYLIAISSQAAIQR